MFSGVPEWFYLIAFVVVIAIVIINEWWTR